MSQPEKAFRRPRPVITPETSAFWSGAAAGELVLQRCMACGHFDHPPYPECTRCHSMSLTHSAVSGRGTIFERTIVMAPIVRGFEDRVPYACLVVELDEQPELFVLGNLVGAPPEDAVIGRRVEVCFEQIDDEYHLPMFRLAPDA